MYFWPQNYFYFCNLVAHVFRHHDCFATIGISARYVFTETHPILGAGDGYVICPHAVAEVTTASTSTAASLARFVLLFFVFILLFGFVSLSYASISVESFKNS